MDKEKEITNKELLDSINRSFSRIEEKMATKEDLLKVQLQVGEIESDLKSFKKDTQDNFDKLNDKFDDLNDTVMNHDTRIEKLEGKVFAKHNVLPA